MFQTFFGELDSFNLESWRFFIWRVGHISFYHLDIFCFAIWLKKNNGLQTTANDDGSHPLFSILSSFVSQHSTFLLKRCVLISTMRRYVRFILSLRNELAINVFTSSGISENMSRTFVILTDLSPINVPNCSKSARQGASMGKHLLS